jgi:hypothetical protein
MRGFLGIWLILAVTDNALFVIRVALISPSEGILTTNAEALELMEHYRQREGSICFHTFDRGLAVHIMASSRHLAWLSEPFLSYDYVARMNLTGKQLQNRQIGALLEIGIDEIIVPLRTTRSIAPWLLEAEGDFVVFANGGYRVISLHRVEKPTKGETSRLSLYSSAPPDGTH